MLDLPGFAGVGGLRQWFLRIVFAWRGEDAILTLYVLHNTFVLLLVLSRRIKGHVIVVDTLDNVNACSSF